MIRSIELWDFESHEHTLIDDLSDTLNALVGPSNAGKSAIVRALKLVAYNEFDPASVRTGSKHCKVKVTTDKGSVTVTRGSKDNLWEIEEKGQPLVRLDKVGTKPVPQACEIVGMGIVKLGDVDVPVNIMDQLEAHFMLAGIGDDKATGSVRAQILDEVSGLSGIEGIIKSVSLDNSRNGREITRLETQIEETAKRLHDEQELKREVEACALVEQTLIDYDESLNAARLCRELSSEWKNVMLSVDRLNEAIRRLPDLTKAAETLKEAEFLVLKGKEARNIRENVLVSETGISVARKRLKVIPRTDEASSLLDGSVVKMTKGTEAIALSTQYRKLLGEETELRIKLNGMTDMGKVPDLLKKVSGLLVRLERMKELLREITVLNRGMEGKKMFVVGMRTKIDEAKKGQDEIMAGIKVCPLTLEPISGDCLKGVPQ